MVVAIVDDDRAVREPTEMVLELFGFETASFASASEFLAVDPSPYKFLLVDYHMPQMTGLDLLVELRRRRCATPVAIMTASFSIELRDKAVDLGAGRVFRKPIDQDELVDLIRSAVA